MEGPKRRNRNPSASAERGRRYPGRATRNSARRREQAHERPPRRPGQERSERVVRERDVGSLGLEVIGPAEGLGATIPAQEIAMQTVTEDELVGVPDHPDR